MRIENNLLKKIAKLKEQDAKRGLHKDDELEDSHPAYQIYRLTNEQLKAYAFTPTFYVMIIMTPVILSLSLDIAQKNNKVLFALAFTLFLMFTYLFSRVFYYIFNKIDLVIDEEGIYTNSYIYKKLFKFQPIWWKEHDSVQILHYTGLMDTKFAHSQKFDSVRKLDENDHAFFIITDKPPASAQSDSKNNKSEKKAKKKDKKDKPQEVKDKDAADKPAGDKTEEKKADGKTDKADDTKKDNKKRKFWEKPPPLAPMVVIASTSWQITDGDPLLMLFEQRLERAVTHIDISSSSSRLIPKVSVDDKMVYAMNVCLFMIGLGCVIAWLDTYHTLSYGYYLYLPLLISLFTGSMFYGKFMHGSGKRWSRFIVAGIVGVCCGFLLTSALVWIMPRVEKKHDVTAVLNSINEQKKNIVHQWQLVDNVDEASYTLNCKYDNNNLPTKLPAVSTSKTVKIAKSAGMIRTKKLDVCSEVSTPETANSTDEATSTEAVNQNDNVDNLNNAKQPEFFDVQPADPDFIDPEVTHPDNSESNSEPNDESGEKTNFLDKLKWN